MSDWDELLEGLETLKAGRCPKCAFQTGWRGPKFIAGARVPMAAGSFVRVTRDRLAFNCNTCGYEFYTPTYDAPAVEEAPPPPPAPPKWSDPNTEVVDGPRWMTAAFWLELIGR